MSCSLLVFTPREGLVTGDARHVFSLLPVMVLSGEMSRSFPGDTRDFRTLFITILVLPTFLTTGLLEILTSG